MGNNAKYSLLAWGVGSLEFGKKRTEYFVFLVYEWEITNDEHKTFIPEGPTFRYFDLFLICVMILFFSFHFIARCRFLSSHLNCVFQLPPFHVKAIGFLVSVQCLQDLFFYISRCHSFDLKLFNVEPDSWGGPATPVICYPHQSVVT